MKTMSGGRSFLWAAHHCAALATYPEVVTHRAGTFPPKRNPPLFGLAPCGVCPATVIADGAVRSYRTFSPLPRLTEIKRAVCFLWHFPSTALWEPPPGRYPAHCSVEFGLSSASPLRPNRSRDNARRQRPSGPAANRIIITLEQLLLSAWNCMLLEPSQHTFIELTFVDRRGTTVSGIRD